MRVKVTTEIDINIKMLFEAFKKEHGKTYKTLLEDAILDLMKDYDPIAVLEERIKIREQEIREYRDLRAQMQVLQPAQKRIKEYEDRIGELERLREEMFLEQKDAIIRLWNQNPKNINWPVMVDKGEFKNQAEARAWVRQRVRRENDND